MADLLELTTTECESLLRAGILGRIAMSTPEGPFIVPVNYSVVDDTILVRTSPDGMIAGHCDGAAVAFEVDQFDYPNGRGWSVLARGHAHIVDDPGELNRIRDSWQPRPWAGGPRPLVLRLAWTELSGRKLGVGWEPLRHLPVRRVISFHPSGR